MTGRLRLSELAGELQLCCLVDSVQLFGSMGYCTVTQTGSAWVVSTLPSGAKETRLIGIAGEGVDCKVSSTSTG